METLLAEKAQKSELTLCLPDRSPLSDRLSKAGATIWTFNELDLVPNLGNNGPVWTFRR